MAGRAVKPPGELCSEWPGELCAAGESCVVAGIAMKRPGRAV